MADNFYSSLNGIPIDYLVATPLLAAGRANLALAQNLEEFINEIAFEDGPGSNTNLVTFDLTRPYTDPNTGELKTETIKVEAPLIGLIPLPALLVDNVTVNFSTTVNTSTSTNTSVNANVAASYGFGAFQMSGSVSTSVSHMRSSNQSATYTFQVQADQQPATEGMGKLMDVFASTIEPIPTGGNNQ